jgi:hypothetical protein
MEYTTRKVAVSRGHLQEQEARVARQRKKVEQAIADRSAAEEMQARLLIMEQSLIAMARFLKILERDLQSDLSIQGYATQKRIKDRRELGRSETLVQAADQFAPPAPTAALTPDRDFESLDKLAKAIEKPAQ